MLSKLVNEGSVDRVARVILGTALMLIGFVVVGGTGGTVLGVIGLVPLLTGLSGWCPLYSLLGVDTCSRRDAR
jgi:hypothetical protein